MSSVHSVLFEPGHAPAGDQPAAQPECFADLNLDQVIASITAPFVHYDLEPLFHHPLTRVEAVQYRHHVLTDLLRPAVLAAVGAFADGMSGVRRRVELAATSHYARQRQAWFLSAVEVYCTTTAGLHDALAGLELDSAGLVGLRDHLSAYVCSPPFATLRADTLERRRELAAVRYTVSFKGNRVRVRDDEDEPELNPQVEATFAKFRPRSASTDRPRLRESVDMNHIEAQILDLVARLHPDTFARLSDYCDRHAGYVDDTLARFDREVHFYLAYLRYIQPLEDRGLAFSVPRVSARSKEEHAADTFDLALAAKLAAEGASPVANDLALSGAERILVISGPNNGGKTTIARAFGQLHYLAALGVPVPGREVRLFLPDAIFTHFEREEDITTLRGKFEDELHRIHDILKRATGSSVVIMNESFGSTTVEDARQVGAAIIEQLIDRDLLAVFVTFIDELASLDDSIVSMMSTVVPGDPAQRTYKVIRRPADGRAYAAALAEKYGLTYDALRRRIAR